MTERVRILETRLLILTKDTQCVFPVCSQGTIILSGKEAVESPSTPGRFYHLECFREIVRSRGKSPDTFIKIIGADNPKKN